MTTTDLRLLKDRLFFRVLLSSSDTQFIKYTFAEKGFIILSFSEEKRRQRMADKKTE